MLDYKNSKKADMYRKFFKILENHLEYSLTQYGDVGDDIITNYSSKDCMLHIEKYVKRFKSNARTGQEKLDLIKIVDYSIRAFYKDDLKVSKSKEQLLLEEIYNSGACEIIDQDVSELLKDYIEK